MDAINGGKIYGLCRSGGNKAIYTFSKITYKPSKLGQTELVFGLWSEFIRRFVHAGLSTCSGYDL